MDEKKILDGLELDLKSYKKDFAEDVLSRVCLCDDYEINNVVDAECFLEEIESEGEMENTMWEAGFIEGYLTAVRKFVELNKQNN